MRLKEWLQLQISGALHHPDLLHAEIVCLCGRDLGRVAVFVVHLALK